MKKLRLPLLTALLTSALVGLVGLQLYWTNMAYKIAQQRFKQTAHEALQSVAQKLEQREIIYLTQQSATKLQDSLRLWEEQRKEYEQARQAQWQTTLAAQQAKESKQKQATKLDIKVKGSMKEYEVSFFQPNQPRVVVMTGQDGKDYEALRYDNAIKEIKEQTKTNFYYETQYFNFSTSYDSSKKVSHLQEKIQVVAKNKPIAKANKKINEAHQNIFGLDCDPNMIQSINFTPLAITGQGNQTPLPTTPLNPLPEKKFIKIENKEDVLKFLVQEIRQAKPDVDKRLNQKLLDSLLKRELAERGINLPYQFGVEVLPRQKMTLPTHQLVHNQQISQDIAQLTNLQTYDKPRYLFFPSQPKEKDNFIKNAFHVQLFPTEIVGNRNTLFVHFPQEINWLWREMALTGGASLLFIALIIGCFAYALYTIWRQKKISEITNDFINNMTHEFKTPVATVSLACEALQDPDMRQIPHYTDRYLQIIKEENERLGRQVERVLQIAVLDRADFRLKLQSCDLHEIVEKALHNISLQVESRQGTIDTDLQALTTQLEADEVHLTNVILNLLDNALKYSPETPHITLTTRNETEGISISIQDRGQGMTKEAQAKIFDKFYRVPTGNVHNVKGFGLGLSYVRTIAMAHHGRVSVQSEVGKGSTFTLYLPFQQNKA